MTVNAAQSTVESCLSERSLRHNDLSLILAVSNERTHKTNIIYILMKASLISYDTNPDLKSTTETVFVSVLFSFYSYFT